MYARFGDTLYTSYNLSSNHQHVLKFIPLSITLWIASFSSIYVVTIIAVFATKCSLSLLIIVYLFCFFQTLPANLNVFRARCPS